MLDIESVYAARCIMSRDKKLTNEKGENSHASEFWGKKTDLDGAKHFELVEKLV